MWSTGLAGANPGSMAGGDNKKDIRLKLPATAALAATRPGDHALETGRPHRSLHTAAWRQTPWT